MGNYVVNYVVNYMVKYVAPSWHLVGWLKILVTFSSNNSCCHPIVLVILAISFVSTNERP